MFSVFWLINLLDVPSKRRIEAAMDGNKPHNKRRGEKAGGLLHKKPPKKNTLNDECCKYSNTKLK